MAEPLTPLAKSIPLEHKYFYSLEYPGYVASTSFAKAVDRLGGPQILADTFRRGLKVDLKLKDNDPYAHPPNGQVVPTYNLVLKVVKRKRKRQANEGETSSGTETQGQFTAQVVGISQKTLRFRTPIDFQYQPPKDDPIVELRDAMMRLDANYILSYRLPVEMEDFTLSPEEQQERGLASSSNARIFPPPLFSRYDMPVNYNFKPNPSSVQQTVIDKVTGEKSTRLVNTSKHVNGHPISIKWSEPTPTSLGKEREALRPLVNQGLLQRVEEKLRERPIWTRLGMFNQLDSHDVRALHNSKLVWALCSYVFHDGPWRDTVIRMGYDPRQEPEAIMYQIIALRNAKKPTLRPSVLQSGAPQGESQRNLDSHTFDGKSPRTAGTFQLCDITDPLIRGFIDDPDHRTDTCNIQDGWLDHVTSERIKGLMKFKHQRLCDTGIAPTDEDCATLLAPDDQLTAVNKKLPTTSRSDRRKAKVKSNMPEEEAAARRLELAVSRLEMEEESEYMDVDE